MKTQTLLAPLRRAINDYDMINEGDKIAVGVSGGKDSLALLALLNAYARFSPQRFSLLAITIDMGFTPDAYSEISIWCKKNDIDYIVEKTNIAQILFEIRKEKNPCSLCSKLRRGALNSIANKHNCNKLALGHHSDDVMETFLLSMIYEGRLSTLAPKSFLSRSKISLIRPMIYVKEKDIKCYARDEHLPILHNPCPADKHTQRQFMKELLSKIQEDIPFSKDRIFSAISNPDRYNLWNDTFKKFEADKNTDI